MMTSEEREVLIAVLTRVKAERTFLENNLNGLTKFLNGVSETKREKISDKQMDLLRRQKEAMDTYYQILTERIDLIEEDLETK